VAAYEIELVDDVDYHSQHRLALGMLGFHYSYQLPSQGELIDVISHLRACAPIA